MEQEFLPEARILTHEEIGGTLPHGWAISVCEGYYTAFLGEERQIGPYRSLLACCEQVALQLAIPNRFKPTLREFSVARQLTLW